MNSPATLKNDPEVSNSTIDHAAIDFLQQAIDRLRSGEALGFVGALHLPDNNFDLCLSQSVFQIPGLEAIDALGELMHRLG